MISGLTTSVDLQTGMHSHNRSPLFPCRACYHFAYFLKPPTYSQAQVKKDVSLLEPLLPGEWSSPAGQLCTFNPPIP